MSEIIIVEKNVFRDGSGTCRIGFGVFGAVEEIASLYDLISVQIPGSVLRRIRKITNDRFPNRADVNVALEREQYFDEFLAVVMTNCQSDAEQEVFGVLSDIVDFKTLTTKALCAFTEEITEHLGQCISVNEEFPWESFEDEKAHLTAYLSQIQAILKSRAIGYVYLIKSASGYWKIGKTINPDDRMKTFSVKLPFEVEYEHIIPCQNHHAAEDELHLRFASKRVNGEWFCLDASDIAWIKAIKFM